MERTKLPDINQKVNDMSINSDYGADNQVTDYTQDNTKGLLTNSQSRGNTNVMYFPEGSDGISINNSMTYHGAKNRNMINNKFGGGGVSANTNTRYVNQVNKHYI